MTTFNTYTPPQQYQPYLNAPAGYYPPDYQMHSNYYQSPIIQDPVVPNYRVDDAYYNYYNNYSTGAYCGCSSSGNYQSPGGQYYGGYYPYNSAYPSYGGCNSYTLPNCGCNYDCGQYGLSFDRSRLTPNFPKKLGHSYITSGAEVQNKLVINEPSIQSAPFQTQRRKTYQPYTRKYIDYEDYIQYIPVQRSEWNYKKVMKQVDFVPQEYYESSIEYLPRQKTSHRLQYLPVQHQLVHVPATELMTNKGSIQNNNLQRNTVIRNVPLISDSRFKVVNSGNKLTSSGLRTRPLQQSAYRTSQLINNAINIRPAESTVYMIPNPRLKPITQIRSQDNQSLRSSRNMNSYKFPSSGGVMIGSSSPIVEQKYSSVSNSFGPQGRVLENEKRYENPVQVQQIVDIDRQSGNSKFEYERSRQSGRIEYKDSSIGKDFFGKGESIVNQISQVSEEQN